MNELHRRAKSQAKMSHFVAFLTYRNFRYLCKQAINAIFRKFAYFDKEERV